jgi:hypothetical protein
MTIGARQRHSRPGETRRRKFSRWFGLSRGSGLSTAVLLITFTITCSGSSAARDLASAKGQKTEIPFQLYNGNLIIVKATIGTVENEKMILDTGTSPSAISQDLADRLKLRGKTESLQTLNGTIQTQSLILPSIQIGPLAASPIRVVVQNLGFMERSLGISLGGIVGLDILSSGSFTIDYRRKKIVFGPIARAAWRRSSARVGSSTARDRTMPPTQTATNARARCRADGSPTGKLASNAPAIIWSTSR